jgi:hypothetical protein
MLINTMKTLGSTLKDVRKHLKGCQIYWEKVSPNLHSNTKKL